MAGYSDILERLKTLMELVDPSPSEGPGQVYRVPGDTNLLVSATSIHKPSFPFIVVSRATEIETDVSLWTLSSVKHMPTFQILIFLRDAILEPEGLEAASLAAEKEPDWIPAVIGVLRDDQTLNSVALKIGEFGDDVLFQYQTGHIPFLTKTFWGIRFELAVNQEIS